MTYPNKGWWILPLITLIAAFSVGVIFGYYFKAELLSYIAPVIIYALVFLMGAIVCFLILVSIAMFGRGGVYGYK
jgi:ABC-type transport system involved in multi-copper enzyme maturation permease subunit